MNKMMKIAALATALTILPASLFGCRNEKELTASFEVPKLGCEKIAALDSGEIMVYETFTTEKDLDDLLYSKVTETYVKFVRGDSLYYDFTESVKRVATEEVDLYEATNDYDGLYVTRNGEEVSPDEAPDISVYYTIDYDVADIEDIVIANNGEGMTIYAITMTGAYADKFDTAFDGVTSDCTKVIYNYYVDKDGVTRNIVSEFTSTVTYNGESQTTVRFIQTTIES